MPTSFLLAFGAGLISFLSPCVLPLVPSYLSLVGGVSFAELAEQERRGVLLVRTLAFVTGFSLVFIVLGLAVASGAALLGGSRTWVPIISGILIALMGLQVAFDLIPALNVERRGAAVRGGRLLASFAGGAAFGAGWTPCIGPVLASILLFAGSTGGGLGAVSLLAVYALGLGLPFILAALAFERFRSLADAIKPHLHRIRRVSGLILMTLGLIVATGQFARLSSVLPAAGRRLSFLGEDSPILAQTLAIGLPLLASLLCGWWLVSALQKRRSSGNNGLLSLATGTPAILLVGFAASSLAAALGRLDTLAVVGSWLAFQGI